MTLKLRDEEESPRKIKGQARKAGRVQWPESGVAKMLERLKVRGSEKIQFGWKIKRQSDDR